MISSMMLITDNNENSSQTFSHPTINALRWPWMRMKWRWCKFGWRFLESGDFNWKVVGVVIIMSKCKITISWNQTQVCEMNQIPLLCILICCGLALCVIFSRLLLCICPWASAEQPPHCGHQQDRTSSSTTWPPSPPSPPAPGISRLFIVLLYDIYVVQWFTSTVYCILKCSACPTIIITLCHSPIIHASVCYTVDTVGQECVVQGIFKWHCVEVQSCLWSLGAVCVILLRGARIRSAHSCWETTNTHRDPVETLERGSREAWWEPRSLCRAMIISCHGSKSRRMFCSLETCQLIQPNRKTFLTTCWFLYIRPQIKPQALCH